MVSVEAFFGNILSAQLPETVRMFLSGSVGAFRPIANCVGGPEIYPIELRPVPSRPVGRLFLGLVLTLIVGLGNFPKDGDSECPAIGLV